MKQRLSAEAAADRASEACYTHPDSRYRNPHSVANVNAPMGPRMGNEGAHSAKRGNFLDAKASRQPLAEQVQQLLEARGRKHQEHLAEWDTEPGMGSDDEVTPKRFSPGKRTHKYRD